MGIMRVAMLLVLGAVVVNCHGIATSPMDGLLQVIDSALPALKDIFSSVFGRVNVVAFRAALAVVTELVGTLFPTPPIPEVPERWWGDGSRNDTSIRPFKVHFSQEMISDLRGRICHRRNITHALRGAANTYGSHSGFLSETLEEWAHQYNFKEREDWLNSFTQRITNIQGLDIHYIHVRPPNPRGKKVLPLLLLHGWPVTAFEYVHVIELLLLEREECDFVFEIIAPDLPGFGYSEGTNQIGMALYQMGIIMKNLMLRLNHPRFYIHAGDAGHGAADAIAVLFPERVLGYHSNFPFSINPKSLTKWVLGQLYPPAVVAPRYENRLYPLTARLNFYLEHFGYFHVQASKPDNIGHALDESPVALASWLIQLIIMTTDPQAQREIDGAIPENFDMNDWLDSWTIYWDARCGTTSARMYAEFLAVFQDPQTLKILMTPTPVPFAAINFRHEVIYHPDDFLRDKYPNLVQSITPDFGGHFAGYQKPEALADSIRSAVTKMEQFHQNEGVNELNNDVKSIKALI